VRKKPWESWWKYTAKTIITKEGNFAEYAAFIEYVFKHLENCPFQKKKTACGRCLRCYPPNFEEKAIEIMGFAGPKMFRTIRFYLYNTSETPE
jgi:hypothetical protein